MIESEFDALIDKLLGFLSDDCRKRPERYIKGGVDFEPTVKEAAEYAIGVLGLEARVDYEPGSHSFPDIVVHVADGSKYGIEVKSLSGTGDSWKINGNSVLGSTRVPGISKSFVLLGKMRGEKSLFRMREYEKSISNVVVTHSPRYLLDLDVKPGESFFDKSNLSYDEITASKEPIKLITDYFSSIGQKAWWLVESTPATILMFNDLAKRQRQALIGYGLAHYKEIFSKSNHKFYRYMAWLVSEKGVVDPSLRDRFTAGGKTTIELRGSTYRRMPHIFKTVHKYRNEVLRELENADLETLQKDWGTVPGKTFKDRIEQWVENVSSATQTEIDIDDVKRIISEILLDN